MPIDFSQIKIPSRPKEKIWEKAEAVRQRCWNDKIPVNVELIAERCYEIYFTPVNGLRSLANTEAFLLSSLDEIVCDIGAPDVRLRFTIAHELGHRELHPDQIKALRQTGYEDWKAMLDEMPPDLWSRAEFQASEFAGRLLVPRKQLIDAITSIKPLICRALAASPDLEDQALNLAVARKIAIQFNVSGDVLIRRLTSEGLNCKELAQ